MDGRVSSIAFMTEVSDIFLRLKITEIRNLRISKPNFILVSA